MVKGIGAMRRASGGAASAAALLDFLMVRRELRCRDPNKAAADVSSAASLIDFIAEAASLFIWKALHEPSLNRFAK